MTLPFAFSQKRKGNSVGDDAHIAPYAHFWRLAKYPKKTKKLCQPMSRTKGSAALRPGRKNAIIKL